MWKQARAEASYKSMLEGIANLTLNALANWTSSTRPDTSGLDTGGKYLTILFLILIKIPKPNKFTIYG